MSGQNEVIGNRLAPEEFAALFAAASSIRLEDGLIYLAVEPAPKTPSKPWKNGNEQRELQRAYKRRFR